MAPQDITRGRRYRNLKTRNIYVVQGFATHSETLERLVLYSRVDEPLSSLVWARPEELFAQKFEEQS